MPFTSGLPGQNSNKVEWDMSILMSIKVHHNQQTLKVLEFSKFTIFSEKLFYFLESLGQNRFNPAGF